MGSVVFIPDARQSYFAEYSGPDAVKRKSEIGSPKSGAASLRYQTSCNRSAISIAGEEGKDLELVMTLRGKGIFSSPISPADSITFDNKDMMSGLYQALFVSRTDSAVLSERVFFIGADRLNERSISLSPDSTSIKLQALSGTTGGDCSIRIINGNLLPGKADSDIRTQLLLQSELHGRIESPAYYFTDVDNNTERHLDLLMMINGWSRYNLPDAILGRYEEPQIPLEIGQEISGQVRSRWRGKPMEGVMIYAIAPKYNFGTFAETDANGNFNINGFDFPEGTAFIFRAMNDDGKNEGNYDIKTDTFPSIDLLNESPSSVSTIDASDFFNGMRWVMLDEVKVQAFRHDDDSDIFKALASYSRTSDKMASRGVNSLEQAIRFIPGMTIKDNYVFYRNQRIAFYIDGELCEYAGGDGTIYVPTVTTPSKLPGTYTTSRAAHSSPSNLNPYDTRMSETGTYPASNKKESRVSTLNEVDQLISFPHIDRIVFIKHNDFVVGSNYGGGVIVITSKDS